MDQQELIVEFDDLISELTKLVEKSGFSNILDNEGAPYCFVILEIEDWLTRNFPNQKIKNTTVSKIISIAERRLLQLDVEGDKQEVSEENEDENTYNDSFCEDDEWSLEWLTEYLGHHYDFPNLYVDDWNKVSENYKSSVGWVCEFCGVNLDSYKNLLHTHHIDGNKTNNEDINLCALCVLCHSNESGHEFMKSNIKFKNQIKYIIKLRKQN